MTRNACTSFSTASFHPTKLTTSSQTTCAPDTCPACGGTLREISRSRATRVDWRRGHFVTVRVERPSCACDRCKKVETAPEPSSFALPRSIVGNGLAAQIVVDKFADNIPLNRQATRFEREGLELSPSTLGDVVRNVAGLLSRIVLAMKDEQRGGRWLQADDTGLPACTMEVSPLFGYDAETFTERWSKLPAKPAVTEGLYLE